MGTGVDQAAFDVLNELGTRGEARVEPGVSLMATAEGSGFIQSPGGGAGSRA